MTQTLTILNANLDREHSTLRKSAKVILNPTDQKIQNLIDELIETAKLANGVGIAAPQVDRPDRLFIIASRPNLRYPNAPLMEPTAMINPRIIDRSDEIIKDWEGCLSIPGIRGLVPRSKNIKVEYINRSGQKQQQYLTDFVARIFQHELDHLDGILFVDRVENQQDLYTEEAYLQVLVEKRDSY